MKSTFFSFCCCLCLVLTSCSLPHTVPRPDLTGGKEKKGGRLLSIRVERWDTLRFSGLLGLRKNPTGLEYVLLDATGAKLLMVEVAENGSQNLLRVSGPLKKTDFAPFLSEALARIYLQEPAGTSCIGSWLYQVCREESEDKSWSKYGKVGPFKLWRILVDPADFNAPEAKAASLVYHQPWLGVRISLEPTKLSP